MSRFGDLVRTLRHQEGMGVEKVAKKVRTSKSYISAIENGKSAPPSGKMVERFHKAFGQSCVRQGITIEDLVELAWADKAPELIRDRVAERLGRANPLFRAHITGPQVTLPGAHAASEVG